MNDDLVRRVDRLESIEAIRTLKHRYMTYCDLGYPPDKLSPLFTEDAVWASKDFGHHAGRAAIEAFFAGVSSQIVFAAHLAMNGIVEVDGDRGTGNWRILMPCTIMDGGQRTSRWLLGDYVEEYVRRNDVWLFKKMDYVMNYNVAFDQPWSDVAVVREH